MPIIAGSHQIDVFRTPRPSLKYLWTGPLMRKINFRKMARHLVTALMYLFEISSVIPAAYLTWDIAASTIRAPAPLTIVFCIIWCALVFLAFYCLHSQRPGIWTHVWRAIPPILFGFIIFAIQWPNILVFRRGEPAHRPLSAVIILCIVSLSPILCYFLKIIRQHCFDQPNKSL